MRSAEQGTLEGTDRRSAGPLDLVLRQVRGRRADPADPGAVPESHRHRRRGDRRRGRHRPLPVPGDRRGLRRRPRPGPSEACGVHPAGPALQRAGRQPDDGRSGGARVDAAGFAAGPAARARASSWPSSPTSTAVRPACSLSRTLSRSWSARSPTNTTQRQARRAAAGRHLAVAGQPATGRNRRDHRRTAAGVGRLRDGRRPDPGRPRSARRRSATSSSSPRPCGTPQRSACGTARRSARPTTSRSRRNGPPADSADDPDAVRGPAHHPAGQTADPIEPDDRAGPAAGGLGAARRMRIVRHRIDLVQLSAVGLREDGT